MTEYQTVDNSNFYVYYTCPEGTRNLNSLTNEITLGQWEEGIPYFHMAVESERRTDDELRQYLINFKQWTKELGKELIKMKIKYYKCMRHSTAVEVVFKYLTQSTKHLYQNMPDINKTEYQYMESTYNAGLIYCDKLDNPIQTYSYDLSFYYARLLGTPGFFIPNCAGYEDTIEKLPISTKLLFGFYRVKITSENPDSRKVFSFNYKNVYNYYDVKFALKNRSKFGFKLEMIIDGNPNAYLYDDVIESCKIFAPWYEKLLLIRQKYPKNQLCKQLSSTLWGVISQTLSFKISEDKLCEEPERYEKYTVINVESFGAIGSENYRTKYELIDENKPYKNQIRLKGWLNAYSRCETAKYVMTDIDNVIRVYTDSIAFKVPHPEFENDLMKLEKKSTGFIKWNSAANYKHVTL